MVKKPLEYKYKMMVSMLKKPLEYKYGLMINILKNLGKWLCKHRIIDTSRLNIGRIKVKR